MSKRQQRKAQRKRRNSAFKIRGLVGMFDSSNRDEKLSSIGDPLERLDAEIDWELFRPTLEQLYAGGRKGPAGPKADRPGLDVQDRHPATALQSLRRPNRVSDLGPGQLPALP